MKPHLLLLLLAQRAGTRRGQAAGFSMPAAIPFRDTNSPSEYSLSKLRASGSLTGVNTAIAGNDAHATGLGALHELAHAHIAPAGIDMQFNNGLGGSFHAHTHRMETKNHFERDRHALIIQPRPVRRLQWQYAVGSAG